MKKIKTIFERNDSGFVVPAMNPECSWVFNGQTLPLRKYDGICMKLDSQGWLYRREVKPGKSTPDDFILEEFDEKTGKKFGWLRVDSLFSYNSYFNEAEALEPLNTDVYEIGTYELIGPKINNNPENVKRHRLVYHKNTEVIGNIFQLNLPELDIEDSFSKLKNIFSILPIEGVVFYGLNEDYSWNGLRAKLKKRDFKYE